MMPRAVAYIRVSTLDQVEGYSLAAQRRAIKQYCEAHGHELVRTYADEGASAHADGIESRPQLASLLNDATQGAFDLVVVHMLDRWARNVGVQREALQRLGAAGVGFASVAEQVDFTTPAGRLTLNMLGSVAEFFSDQLASHVSKAVAERAELGLPVGPIPFGYRPVEGRAAPEVEAREGAAVREAFMRRIAGSTYREIAAFLNDSGFRTRKGRPFSEHAVKDMCRCRFYCGVVTYRGREYPGRHEAIISEEVYRRVEALRSHRLRQRRSHSASHGALKGLLACGHCGQPIWSDRTHGGSTLYRERHGFPCHTEGRSVVTSSIDDQMQTIFEAIELPDDWRRRMAEATVVDLPDDDLGKLQERKRRVARAFADGGFSEQEYEGRMAELDDRIRAAATVVSPTIDAAAELFNDLPSLWKRANADERRELLKPLVERVFVDLDSRRIGGVQPTPEFHALLQHAFRKTDHATIAVLTREEAQAVVELVETGENRTPRPVNLRPRFTTGVVGG